MRHLINAFVAASAAGGGTDAMALDTIQQHLGISTFSELRRLVERIRDANFAECVPWSTSTAHFEVSADEIRYVSCAGTVVRITDDESFAIEDASGNTMPEDYYRVIEAAPHLAAYVAGV